MMRRDHRIDDVPTIETTPGGDFIARRAQLKIVIPFLNHESIAASACHTAPPWPDLLVTSMLERVFHNQAKKKKSVQSRIDRAVSVVCRTVSAAVPDLIITIVPCIIVVRKRASARESF